MGKDYIIAEEPVVRACTKKLKSVDDNNKRGQAEVNHSKRKRGRQKVSFGSKG